MKKIKVEVLEKAFTRIIDKLKFEEVIEVEIPHDLYRLIPTYNWEVGNSNLDPLEHVGSLYDDLDHVESLINDKDSLCTYVDFDRVASLLRAISEVRNSPKMG